MPTHTISSSYAQSVTLTAADATTTILSAADLQLGLYAASIGTDWTITNSGKLFASGGAALSLASKGTITNLVGGTISGYTGISASAAATVSNSGSISGSTTSGGRGSAAGINLLNSGVIINQAGGHITGYQAVRAGGTSVSTVTNSGMIAGGTSGINAAGIYLLSGGAVTNQATGTISGYRGIRGEEPSTVANFGTIEALGTGGFGIAVQMSRGDLVNYANATIVGVNGVLGASVVTNSGTILAQNSGRGVYFPTGLGDGTLVNLAGGLISGDVYAHGAATVTNIGSIAGTYNGIRASAAATITNSGVVTAPRIGVIDGGGFLTNLAGATIVGATGVVFFGGAKVTNAGTLDGLSSYALVMSGGSTNRLIVDPGAVFVGKVTGGNSIGAAAVSTMELASTTSVGTISSLGSKYVDFGIVTIDSGAIWTFAGTNTLASGITLANDGALTNAGLLLATGGTVSGSGTLLNDGTVTVTGNLQEAEAVTGTGLMTIGSGGTLNLQSAVSSGQTIAFAAATGTLDLLPSGFSGEILGFQAGDTIDLTGISTANSPSISNNNTLVVQTAGGAVALRLDPTRTYTADEFAIGNDSSPNHYNIITTTQICFLPGTMIRTLRGEIPVENLEVGDFVRTVAGGKRPITWIGTGTVMVPRGGQSAAAPVIVRAGAIADGIPNRDLHVTKGHALFLDDVLIPVEFLVNHRSIVWNAAAEEVTIYHIELDAHDILFANGAPAESYRDDGNRWLFHNANANWDAPEKPHYAPVLTGGPVVDAVWRRLLDRAGPGPEQVLTDDPDLHLLADGVRVEPTRRHPGRYTFQLSARPARLVLASRAAAPQVLGLSRDPRVLGVGIRRLLVWQGATLVMIEAGDDRLSSGFHAFEPDLALRWTEGSAEIQAEFLEAVTGAFELEVLTAGATHYRLQARAAA
jgi:Hint domain